MLSDFNIRFRNYSPEVSEVDDKRETEFRRLANGALKNHFGEFTFCPELREIDEPYFFLQRSDEGSKYQVTKRMTKFAISSMGLHFPHVGRNHYCISSYMQMGFRYQRQMVPLLDVALQICLNLFPVRS
mmetsp:Transcript_13654/g.18908  ORF Transcript_13654/g.18908 Transcript_13654/m.18908 type:complete len:129 (-) Transcript_13654:179-565(-)